MLLTDVNVLIYAHREESPEHVDHARFVSAMASGPEPFALSALVLSGFLRIVTSPRVFGTPSPLDLALRYVEQLRAQPRCVVLRPGPRHWGIFVQLCEAVQARGKLIADAYHAALAIENGCEFVTTDSDYSRFPGLRVRHPLAGPAPPGADENGRKR